MNKIKYPVKHKLFVLLLAGLFISFEDGQLFGQTQKVPLGFNDVRLWRSHTADLSDDGQWYTIRYRLNDKSGSKKDTTLTKLIEQTSSAFYQDNNQTDVLYIHHVEQGLKYQIPGATNPVFSSDSKWIAYKMEPDDSGNGKKEEKKDTTFIELRHLSSAFTIRYESDASFSFPEDKDVFITASDDGLLIYDLMNRTEHYIGDIGEYLVDKESPYIAYTIDNEEKRGNGIYLFHPTDKTTQTLASGNFIFSNLSWNSDHTSLAAYTYTTSDETIDHKSIAMVIVTDIDADNTEVVKYPVNQMEGIPEGKGLATKSGQSALNPIWSEDGTRLFIRLKKVDSDKDSTDTKKGKDEESSTVQVWHWKDKKLLSERILDSETDKDKTYRAIFFCESKKIVPLTGEDIQNYIYSEGTDEWAIGTDNRKYLSDWNVNQHDLYRINLKTGEKKLVETGYRSRYGNQVQMSPDGSKAILWDEKDYWFFDIASNTKRNITKDLPISFIDTDYDYWGWVNSYGFVGWVKDRNAVIINHEYDLWLLPIDEGGKAENLTGAVRGSEPIRFRWEDQKSLDASAPEERYIDLSEPQFLTAFNTKTKHNGFYKLDNGKVSKLVFEPAYYFTGWYPNQIYKAKHSDAILFRKGDVGQFFESYLTDRNFSNPRKISNTNPQQEKYVWGKSILIDYTNDDGVPLQATLTIPENYREGEKLPMVVYTYEKMTDFRYFYSSPRLGSTAPAMFYVSNGYLYLEPDIHFNVGTPHSDMHECIDAAIEKVIELGYVDEERIGYNGFSFGGHTGMYVATQDNKFAAISAGAGVSNLVQGFNVDIVRDGSNEQDYYMTSQGRLGTDPTGDTDMYIRESAVFNAGTMDTPLLLYHGTDDKVVQWEHSFGYFNLLRYLKKPVVLLSYRGEGHGLRKEPNRLDFQKRLKEFFDHYLKGEEAKPWMVDETPYTPDGKDSTLPKWK